ncbi:hypothetical protein F5888DRAFT_1801700 [Russula emetica]|nr:hypothetical protein F5888DRAFT_1801700 [Russula emetica]
MSGAALMHALCWDNLKPVFKLPLLVEEGQHLIEDSTNSALISLTRSLCVHLPLLYWATFHSRSRYLGYTNRLNMSGCAVASDGSLLSPSKIDFYKDPDDAASISGPSLMAPMVPSTSISTSSATTLDNYFASHQPAVTLASVRRTTRPSKPLARVREAANDLNDSVITGKHKGSNGSLHCCVARRVVPDSDGSDVENASDASIPSLKAASTSDDTKLCRS